MRVAMVVEQLWQRVPGGSGTYIRELAAALMDRGDIALTGVRALGSNDSSITPLPNMPLASAPLPRAVLYEAWGRFRRPGVPRTPQMRRAGQHYDVLHATTWAIPPRTAPLVVTVHDTAFTRNRDHFTPRGIAFFEKALDVAVREADAVVVPSEATLADCLSAGFPADRISLIHHGTSAENISTDEAAAFRRRFTGGKDFVLWCGTLEPRKNVGSLLTAYSHLLQRGTDLDLVLVGPQGWGNASSEVDEALAALPPRRVHTLGALDPHNLQVAYAAARAFCFPSLWEGFGMPVLEAMAHGTPVVTSSDTSMAEVCGDGALLVDPLAPLEIAAALERAAGPEHDTLSAAALVNSTRYTWARSAELHHQTYNAAIDRAHNSRDSR